MRSVPHGPARISLTHQPSRLLPGLRLRLKPKAAPIVAAHDAMMVAALRGNADRPIEILAAAGIVPDTTVPRLRLASGDPQSCWDTDDGPTGGPTS